MATSDKRQYAPLGMPSARPFRIDRRTKITFLVDSSDLPSLETRSCSHRKELARLGISHFDYFQGDDVIGLTEKELVSFMRRAKLCISERFGSRNPNAEWVKFAREEKMREILPKISFELSPPFEVHEWNGQDKKDFACIVSQILGPVLKRKILLSVPHAAMRPYDPEGAFHVFVWSTPEKNTERNVPPPFNIFGIKVDCTDKAFIPRPEDSLGILINDGEYAVAELFPNALYIHHDLVHCGTMSEKKIMARLCEKVAEILRNATELERLLAEVHARREEKQRKLFCTLVQKGLSERGSREETTLEHLREQAREARKEYIAAARNLLVLEEQLLDPKRIQEKFEQEISKIQSGQMRLVEPNSIVFGDDGDTLSIRTKPIIAYDRRKDKYHLRGRYEIRLDFNDADIWFFNLDNSGKSDAHIDASDGEPCLGNIADDMFDYITHYEVAAAITLGIAFLQSPDSNDSSGGNIKNFPQVPKPKETK